MTADEVSQLREGDYFTWMGVVVKVAWISCRNTPYAAAYSRRGAKYPASEIRPCSKDELVEAGLWKEGGTVVV